MDQNNKYRRKNERMPRVTKKRWEKVNKVNRRIVDEFLSNISDRSASTVRVYGKYLHHFFYYIMSYKKNLPFYSLSSKDVKDYLDYVRDVLGLSFCSIRLMHRACSAMCVYIEKYANRREYGFREFHNYVKEVKLEPDPPVLYTNPVTLEECTKCARSFVERKMYKENAWFITLYYLGCPHNEMVQFKSSVLHYPLVEGENYVLSNPVQTKKGDWIQYKVPIVVLDAWRMFLSNRSDSYRYTPEFVFVTDINIHRTLNGSYATYMFKKAIPYVINRNVRMVSFMPNIDKIIPCNIDDFKEEKRNIDDEYYINRTIIEDKVKSFFNSSDE